MNLSSMSQAELIARLQALESAQAAQLTKTAIVEIALWPNTQPAREGKKDAQFTGQVVVSRVRVLTDLRSSLDAAGQAAIDVVIAQVTATGILTTSAYADVWANAPATGKSGGPKPVLSGRARNFVGAVKAAEPDAVVALLA